MKIKFVNFERQSTHSDCRIHAGQEKITDVNAKILREQGENILSLLCLRCTSCRTHLSPRIDGEFSY